MDTRDNNDDRAAYNVGAPPSQAARYPIPTQKKRRTAPLWVPFATGIGGLVLGLAGGSGASKDTPAATNSHATATAPAPGAAPAATTKPAAPADKGAMGDVTLGKFTVDTIGAVTVPVTVINHSSKRSNYIIEFEVDNAAGVKIGDGIASTNNIAPGQKAQLSGIAISVGDGPASVKLTNVTRYAS
jgi:hypothetical protein